MYELVNVEGMNEKAIELFEKAHQLDPTSQEMQEMLNFAQEEAKEDNLVPVQAEKDRFETMF